MGTLCVSGAALFKAGANVSTALTQANISGAILQAEGMITSLTRYNWIDGYSTLSVDVKYLLEEICSDIAGMYLINYDMSGYTSRYEAETMMDVLRDAALRGLSILKDRKVQDFMNGEA